MWFAVSAMASGGLAGLFLLAFLTRRANRNGVYIGVVASLLFTVWAVVTNRKLVDLGAFNFPWDDLTIGAIGHVIVFVVGYVGSLLFASRHASEKYVTLWDWMARRG
jgi:SSS family solute:Na+ symporter